MSEGDPQPDPVESAPEAPLSGLEPVPKPWQAEPGGEPEHVEPPAEPLRAEPVPRIPRASGTRRVFDWVWRGCALADTRRELPKPGARAETLAQRARESADLARSILTPADPVDASAQANASELYRQSAYWALAALAVLPNSAALPDRDVASTYSPAIWDALEQPLLVQAAQSPERVESVLTALRTGSFVYFAELGSAEQRLSCLELQKLSALLFAKLDARSHALQAVYFQRVWRLSLIVLAAVGVLFAVSSWRDSRDLAVGKPWRASSKYPGAGCESPAQQCTQSPDVFVHTDQEENPWVEFDLGAVHDISSVKIENRDQLQERAIPLVIEVSKDHKRWKAVARRDQVFDNWRASFDSVPGRWVRLRTHKKTWLHLARVRIFP